MDNIPSVPSCRLQGIQSAFGGQKLQKSIYYPSMDLLSALSKLQGRYGLAWAVAHTCAVHIHTNNDNNVYMVHVNIARVFETGGGHDQP